MEAFIVMPNHIHGIVMIHDGRVGATRADLTTALSGAKSLQKNISDGNEGSPLPIGPAASSLGAILGQFKSRVTKRLWKIPRLAGTPIWQRNYHEHIIRTMDDANRIYEYIQSNPIMWDEDHENPAKAALK
jgi:REP element-mobilizing transposase RayT